MHKKIFLSVLISLCVTLLSSCTNENPGNDTNVTPSGIISDASEPYVTDETDEEYGELASETEITEETEISEPDSDTSDTDISGETEAADTETDIESPPTPSVTNSHTEKQTEASKTQTQAKTQTEAATTAATTQKPPAEVVIPKIKMPEAPGTNVISGTNVEVDYSNASEGYISAVYSGSSKLAKVRIKCGSTQYDHDLSPGGKREYFPLMGNGSYLVSVYEQAAGSKYALLASGDFDVTIKNTTGMYLYPNKYIDFSSSSSCVKKAAEVCAGLTDDVDKIAAIFTYTTDNITYDKQLAATVQSGYVPNPDSTLSAKKGICFDYASLFAAMCRSQGIPTRLVIGYANPDIYHAWNEVYTAETGWITPELFLKNKGYNIADATFYASNSDKDKISKYISDEGNYSAIFRY